MTEDNNKRTTNGVGRIVTGSKVKVDNIIYDVGQVRGELLMLYKNNHFECTALMDEVEVL